jgi:hypothetical protein
MCHLDENAERRYFEKHPEKGRFVWWPTNGTKLDAYNRSAADAAAKVRQWNSSSGWIDPLPTWIDEIERLLQTPRPDNGSLAIYIHCHARVARTARERCQGATICAT